MRVRGFAVRPSKNDRKVVVVNRSGWLAALLSMALISAALAHDKGQWGNTDPLIRDWHQSLMQPDNPNASCCGEAHACWADEIHVRGGKNFETINHDRPAAP